MRSRVCLKNRVIMKFDRSSPFPTIFPMKNWPTNGGVYSIFRHIHIPSCKRLHFAMENHHFQWVNPLFLWPFSIAMLNYQRVYHIVGYASYDIPIPIGPIGWDQLRSLICGLRGPAGAGREATSATSTSAVRGPTTGHSSSPLSKVGAGFFSTSVCWKFV